MNLTERETKIAAAKLKLEEYKLRKDGHILKENNGYMNRNPPIFMGTAEIITSSNVEHNDGYTYNYISNLNNKILVNHPLEERRGSFNKKNSIVNSLSSEDISNFSNDQIYIHPNFASKYYEDNQKYYNDLNSTMHNSIPQNTFAENQNYFYSQENKIINNRDKDVIIEIKDSSKMTNTLQMTPVLNENNKILPNKDQEFIHRLKNYKENLEAALNLTHKFVASLLGSPADSTEVVERTHAAYASELRDTLKDLNLYLPDAAEKVLEASPTEFQIKFDLTLKEIEQKNLLIEELERIERERIKQTKNLTQNNASLSLLLDQKKSESEFYQKKCAELENSLQNFQQRIQELKAEAQDGKNLLKQTESDKIATSRALSQNKALKARLEELEKNYVVKSEENMKMSSNLQSQQYALQDLKDRLHHATTHVDSLNQKVEENRIEITDLMAQVKELSQDVTEKSSDSHLELQMRLKETEEELNSLREQNLKLTRKHEDHLSNCSSADTSRMSTPDPELPPSRRQYIASLKETELQKDAFSLLEQRFKRSVKENVDLKERNEGLEHLITLLEGESECIGEYIAIYHAQRNYLNKKNEDRESYLTRLVNQHVRIREKLSDFKELLSLYAPKTLGHPQETEIAQFAQELGLKASQILDLLGTGTPYHDNYLNADSLSATPLTFSQFHSTLPEAHLAACKCCQGIVKHI